MKLVSCLCLVYVSMKQDTTLEVGSSHPQGDPKALASLSSGVVDPQSTAKAGAKKSPSSPKCCRKAWASLDGDKPGAGHDQKRTVGKSQTTLKYEEI